MLARADLHVRDLAEPHEVAVLALRDHEIAELIRGLVVACDAHLEIDGPSDSMRPAGSSRFSRVQRRLDVGDREVARGERKPVDPDAHRRAAGAERC